MATGGLVPPLLEPLASPPGGGAPILRARLLEILRVLYEHHPRPKEFIMKFRIQVTARRDLAHRALRTRRHARSASTGSIKTATRGRTPAAASACGQALARPGRAPGVDASLS
jgi:hypothetical protein